jgi:hypothetical protein
MTSITITVFLKRKYKNKKLHAKVQSKQTDKNFPNNGLWSRLLQIGTDMLAYKIV